jgi:hypothetical protein
MLRVHIPLTNSRFANLYINGFFSQTFESKESFFKLWGAHKKNAFRKGFTDKPVKKVKRKDRRYWTYVNVTFYSDPANVAVPLLGDFSYDFRAKMGDFINLEGSNSDIDKLGGILPTLFLEDGQGFHFKMLTKGKSVDFVSAAKAYEKSEFYKGAKFSISDETGAYNEFDSSDINSYFRIYDILSEKINEKEIVKYEDMKDDYVQLHNKLFQSFVSISYDFLSNIVKIDLI